VVTSYSTLIGQNTTPTGFGADFSGTFARATFTLLQSADDASGITDGQDGNIVGKDPMLVALAVNGGPTQTHALLPGSPAINAGGNALNLGTDQRGFARVALGAADIGAFEVIPPPQPAPMPIVAPVVPLLPLPVAPVVFGDINGNGRPQRIAGVVTPDGAFVEIALGKNRKRRFRAFPGKVRSPLLVSLGNWNGDGRLAILVRQAKAPGSVRVFSTGGALLAVLPASDPRLGG
jgi:hypothetical protein